MNLEEMIKNKLFTHTKSSGFITYDAEQLVWINSKWMQKISLADFIIHLNRYKNNNLFHKKTKFD